jgi:hypothetical protein
LDDSFEQYFVVAALAWFALQGIALWKLRGPWRMASWISAGAMALALGVAVLGGLAGSNIAPLWVILALPVCLLWIVVLWFARVGVWLWRSHIR